MKQIGIYVHIPFCKRKCNYCDFISYSNKENIIEDYIKCVCNEINDVGQEVAQNIKDKKIDDLIVKTIYIGGGTPSVIDSKYIKQLLEEIYKNFKIDENAEITIEVNPGTIDKDKLIEYKNSKINRISLRSTKCK